MKAIKKWLYDKEGLFIIITWWFIALVIFSIILGTSINNVSKNSQITKDTAPSYVEAFIESGDNVIPYNENVKSVSVGKYKDGHKLDIREYHYVSSIEHTAEFTVAGAGTSIATIKYDLEVIQKYYLSYNYSAKKLTIQLFETSTEKAPENFPASLKKTESGSIHVLWNKEDTGVEIKVGEKITFGKQEEFVVVNGTVTDVQFYEVDAETNKAKVEYSKDTSSANVIKEVSYELIVEYKNNAKTYTTPKYSTDDLNETEVKVLSDATLFYTEMIEGSIGINSSSFTLLIVSAVVDSLLVIGAVVGIILIKRSKDE